MILKALKNLWSAIIATFKGSATKQADIDEAAQNKEQLGQTQDINFNAMYVTSFTNMSCYQSNFDCEVKNVQAQPISDCCEDLQENAFAVGWNMLGSGDCFAFYAKKPSGKHTHILLDRSQVIILKAVIDEIIEADVEMTQKSLADGNSIYLIRKHLLDDMGNLHLTYRTVNSNNTTKPTPQEWVQYKDQIIPNANHIGFGRYKSPKQNRGNNHLYGVPIFYGTTAIQERVRLDLQNIIEENKQGKSKVFAYGDIARQEIITKYDDQGKAIKQAKGEYKIIDNVFNVKRRAGETGTPIDIFAPSLRTSAYWNDFDRDVLIMDKEVGGNFVLSAVFNPSGYANEVNIKTQNKDTRAMVDSIQKSMDKGNKDTLRADSVMLGIPEGLWVYSSAYYDVFVDERLAFEMIRLGVQDGAVSKWRETQHIISSLTQDEAKAEIEEISAGQEVEIDVALDNILKNTKVQ